MLICHRLIKPKAANIVLAGHLDLKLKKGLLVKVNPLSDY
ncbi:MAG: hypothetical protein OFPI_01730 [Osedax symbiont Rs2]|nr:MAG: hypothetical protein OFPI_01730 [Osedax symbiont Rs2]